MLLCPVPNPAHDGFLNLIINNNYGKFNGKTIIQIPLR